MPPTGLQSKVLSKPTALQFQGATYQFTLDQPEIRLVGKLHSFTAPGGYRMQIPALCWNEETQNIQFRHYFYEEKDSRKVVENNYSYVATPAHGTVFTLEFGEMVIINQQEKKLRFKDGSWMDAVTGELFNLQGTLIFSKTRPLPDTKPM